MRFIKDFILCIFLLIGTTRIGHAQSVTYKCTYNFGNKVEYIGSNQIKDSVTATKTVGNLKYTFVLSDVNNFSDLEDYVVIENDKGHKITYALACK